MILRWYYEENKRKCPEYLMKRSQFVVGRVGSKGFLVMETRVVDGVLKNAREGGSWEGKINY